MGTKEFYNVFAKDAGLLPFDAASAPSMGHRLTRRVAESRKRDHLSMARRLASAPALNTPRPATTSYFAGVDVSTPMWRGSDGADTERGPYRQRASGSPGAPAVILAKSGSYTLNTSGGRSAGS